jgi:hypothetical protein
LEKRLELKEVELGEVQRSMQEQTKLNSESLVLSARDEHDLVHNLQSKVRQQAVQLSQMQERVTSAEIGAENAIGLKSKMQ